MKKLFSTLLSTAVLLTSVSAFSMNAKQEGSKTVVLEGSTGEANALVAVDVYVNGKTREDLPQMEASELLTALVARMQTQADENGDFEVSFDIVLPTGKYTAFAGTLNTELEPYTFIFVSDIEYGEFAENFSEATKSDIEDILTDTNKCYILGISEEEAKALNTDELAEVIKNTLSDSDVKIEDRDAVWAEVDRAYFVQQLNEGKISDVTKADDSISKISESKVGEWIEKDFVTEDIINEFTEKLSNQDFNSVKDYEEKIVEAFVLGTVKNPGGVSDVCEVVTAFEKEIGINVTNSTPDSVWNKLAGKDYDSFSELEEAFLDYSDEGDTIGSGSSNGGGGSKNKKPAITGEIIVPQDTVKPTTQTKETFTDLDEAAWAKTAIVALADKNIVSGIGNGKFNPNGLVTREQFAKIVVGAFVADSETVAIDFTDVSYGSWYAEFVAKAYGKGIVKGMGDGTFGVGKNITRQDMCVMIYNAAKAAGITFDTSADEAFLDDYLISDYAKEAVYALKNSGAVSGMDEFNFAPQETATRAQAAKIIHYLLEQ